jgi:hypothetical protein
MITTTVKRVGSCSRYLCGSALALLLTFMPTVAMALPFHALLPPVSSSFSFSTIPANGDLNPYGVAFVPSRFPGGHLNPGDILVSNFNNSANQQGTGTTILRVQLSPQTGLQQTSTFATTGNVIGLTAALGAIQQGFVFAGSVSTTNGDPDTVTAGPLLVLDDAGVVADTVDASKLDGPWGLAINSRDPNNVQVLVSNVLDGTISRIGFSFPSAGTIQHDEITQIASKYSHKKDPAAIVIGPAGLAYDQRRDILYVAAEDDDKIFEIADASMTDDNGTGQLIFSDTHHLHGPMGLTLTTDGDLINADPNQPSELVEFTASGRFVRQISIDPNIDGPFGIASSEFNEINELAFVNDNNNTLSLWNFSE